MTATIRASLPRPLLERVRQVCATVPGVTLTATCTDALRPWLEDVEAVAWRATNYDGISIDKAPGAPYPRRRGGLGTGRPLGRRTEGDYVHISFRVDAGLKERVYNALYWRCEGLSDVLREQLKRDTRSI